ncbi:hypothetical protein [Wansuia hejianensis]|uniref:Uncharacterized protein n=1 Tax=Wansuia hejianensis TaxID=2763667 RepID=A0A926IKX8_9FIRM|nr:hypothetical protein [Wansuia hejianensis]MBC8589544.1 hypothetical protein [Wansuia hejianensis]
MDKKNILRKLEEYNIKDEDVEMIEDIAEDYKDKSEEEMFIEIIRLNEKMEEEMSYDEYEAIFEQLEDIRHLLSDEQNEKLNIILKTLRRG